MEFMAHACSAAVVAVVRGVHAPSAIPLDTPACFSARESSWAYLMVCIVLGGAVGSVACCCTCCCASLHGSSSGTVWKVPGDFADTDRQLWSYSVINVLWIFSCADYVIVASPWRDATLLPAEICCNTRFGPGLAVAREQPCTAAKHTSLTMFSAHEALRLVLAL